MGQRDRLNDPRINNGSEITTLEKSGGRPAFPQAGVDERKRVLVLSLACAGKVHDKRLLDESGLAAAIPDQLPIEVDLGFQGLPNEYVNIRIGHNKPSGGELTEAQKAENKVLSRMALR